MLRRFVFLSTAALSLLLCTAAATLWATSYRRGVEVTRLVDTTYRSLAISRGHFRALTADFHNGRMRFPDHPQYSWYSTKRPADFYPVPGHPEIGPSFAGFVIHSSDNEVQRSIVLILPFWAMVLVTIPFPSSAAISIHRRRRRARRLSAGHCPACGYDCRATPDQCPECGRCR
jgi:hypothetical protein